MNFGPNGDLYVSTASSNQIYQFGTVNEALFTVSLSTPFAEPVTVNYTTADGTAVAGTNYTATSGTLTFALGVTSQTIRVSILDSGSQTTPLTFTVSLSNPELATLSQSQATGSITGGNAPTALTVTPDDWTSAGLTLTLGSDGNLHVYTTGITSDAVPPVAPASISSFDITSPSDTTADLTIDSSNGNPIPAGGLNYSGAGGLIKTGSGVVTLTGPNTYSGGTTVSVGTLLINTASALPGGTSLTVGTGGTFVFDPSQSASSVSAARVAAPAPGTATASGTSAPTVAARAFDNVSVSASALSTLPALLERQLRNLSHTPATLSIVANDALFASHRSAINRTASPADTAQSVRPWAWLEAMENSLNSTDQNKTTGSMVGALDTVLARFGV